jgi:hypothetical protein
MVCWSGSSWHPWVNQGNKLVFLQTREAPGGTAARAIARECTVANGLDACEDGPLRRDVGWVRIFGAHGFEDCCDVGFRREAYRKGGRLT